MRRLRYEFQSHKHETGPFPLAPCRAAVVAQALTRSLTKRSMLPTALILLLRPTDMKTINALVKEAEAMAANWTHPEPLLSTWTLCCCRSASGCLWLY